MPVLSGPIAMTHCGDKVTLQFNSELAARQFFNCNYIEREKSGEANNAPALFHIQRGCCDGSDPVACNKARDLANDIAVNERREAARQERERNRRNEYEGTEPSDISNRVSFVSRVSDGRRCDHPKMPIPRMGDTCPDCGFNF